LDPGVQNQTSRLQPHPSHKQVAKFHTFWQSGIRAQYSMMIAGRAIVEFGLQFAFARGFFLRLAAFANFVEHTATVIQLQPLQSRLFALAIALLYQLLLLQLHAVELAEKSLEIAQVAHGYRLLRALLELLLIFIAVRRQLLALLARLLQLVGGVGQLAGGAVLAHM